MAKYTTEVRSICETYAGLKSSVGYGQVEEVIAAARERVFDFSYPIFDTSYKSILETKILKHYYTNEIGFESVGLFKLRLNEAMNRIMPFYNQLYESTLIDYNPMTTTELSTIKNSANQSDSESNHITSGISSEDISKTSNGSGSVNRNDTTSSTEQATNTSSKDHTNKYSDTPQGSLSRIDNNTYLTNATIDEESDTNKSSGIGQSTTTGTETTSNSNTETDVHNNINQSTSADNAANTSIDHYIEQVAGRGIAGADLILKLRETFINIDAMIINELSDLFMLLW